MEYPNLKRWTMPQYYMGEVWPDYYSAGVGRSRDSDTVEESNFRVMLRELGGESETVIVVRESHFLVGWVEWIAIHQDDHKALEIANKQAGRLKGYPILDEHDLSELEDERAATTWANMSVRERAATIRCHTSGVSIFAARRPDPPLDQDDNGALMHYLIS